MIRPASLDDVKHVMSTMWARGRKELSALEVDPVNWIDGWLRRIRRGEAVALDSHAILGWDRESPSVITTSFQASESFELPGVGKRVTKELRAEIPRLMQERRVRQINTYSLCVDPEAPKWFALLGLIEDAEYRGIQRGAYVTRRFVRRA